MGAGELKQSPPWSKSRRSRCDRAAAPQLGMGVLPGTLQPLGDLLPN